MRRLWISLAVAFALLGGAVTASAQNVPPGNAGVDEYTEGVPGAGGDKPSDSVGGGGAGGDANGGGSSSGGGGAESASSLPSDVADAFDQAGTDGAAAANLAEATAPDRSEAARAQATDRSGGSNGDGVGGVVSSVVDGGDGGMGVLLPIILAVTLLAALAFVVARRRSGAAGNA